MDQTRFPVKIDLTMEQGSYWEFEATHTEEGVPVDFFGCTGVCKFRRGYKSTEVVKEFTTANGLFILGSDGKMTIDNSDDFSADLLGSYVYDIFVIDNSGKPEKYYYGNVTVNPSVSV